MTLDIRVGNLFNETMGQKCLVPHGVNAQGAMNSGFAKIVRDLHPFAYLAYKQAQRRYGLKLGQVIVWENLEEERSIAHVVSQEFYGRDPRRVYVSYDALVVGLQAVVKYVENVPDMPIHLPLIGGGLGGGDRKRLIAIMEAVFDGRDAVLWIKDEEQ